MRRRWAVRPTQPSEPILLPKVRIQVADFPYPHSSKPLEAANLGDLMRIWVRSGAECIVGREDQHLREAGNRNRTRARVVKRRTTRQFRPRTTHSDARLGFSRAGRGTSDTARAAVLCGIALLEPAPPRCRSRTRVPNQLGTRRRSYEELATASLSRNDSIPGRWPLNKKRKLFPGPRPASPRE